MQTKTQELRIGPYILLKRLGEGGMGQVYKARHEQTGQIVALKVLRPKLLNNEIAIRRFQREVRVLDKLNHPNIVRVLDAGMDDGQHYFAMELINGADLARIVKQNGPLNVRQACEYIRQTALALQHGLERGMVHRDVKPANLLVMRPSEISEAFKTSEVSVQKWGMVKILDMGLARIISGDNEGATTLLTQLNVIMGTPDFISPEQAINSHECDIRSDLYSLGCTFYFLLAGKTPFPEGNATDKLLKHRLEKPVPVEEVRRQELLVRGEDPKELKYLSSRVGKLVRELMRKNPEKRPQTPVEVAETLAGILAVPSSVVPIKKLPRPDKTPAEATPPAARPRRRNFILLALIVGLLLLPVIGISLALALHSATQNRAVDSQNVSAIEKEWQKLEAKLAEPGGAADKLRQELLDFRLRHPNSQQAQFASAWLLTLPSPFDKLRRTGKPPELVAKLRNVKRHSADRADSAVAVAFSPTARHVAASWAKSGAVLWPSAVLPWSGAPLPEFQGEVNQLTFSPDGRFLALAGGGKIGLRDTAEAKVHLLQDSVESAVLALAFSGDSESVIVVDAGGEVRQLEWSRWTDRNVHPTGEGTDRNVHPTVTELFPPRSRCAVISAAISADGSLIAQGCKDGRVVFLAHGATSLISHEQEMEPSWQPVVLAISPDGQTVAAGCVDGDLQSFIVLYRRDGDRFVEFRQFSAQMANLRALAVSPDNQHILTACEKGELALWNMTDARRLRQWNLGQPVLDIAFAPDGRHAGIALQDGAVYVFRLFDVIKENRS